MPSVRAMAPSAIGGAIIPIALYFGVRPHVSSTATALIIAGIPAALFVLVQWARTRQLDPIGAITLYGFTVGVVASIVLGGNAYVLKIREIAFEVPFAVACLLSVRVSRRPVMFYLGKSMSAGGDELRRRAYDDLYELPTVPEVFGRITIVWGVVMLIHSVVLVLLAAVLPTGAFLIIAGVIAAAMFGGLFVFTMNYSQRARADGEALLVELGLEYPSVPGAVSG